MRSDNNSLWRSYQRLLTEGDNLRAFAAALGAAQMFEERGDFRSSGIWHRETYYGVYLRAKPGSPVNAAPPNRRDGQVNQALRLLASAKQNALRLRCYDAFRLLAQAEEIASNSSGDEYLRAQFYGCRALCLSRIGDIDRTISDYERAVRLMSSAGNLRRAAAFLNSIGFCLVEDQQFERGHEYLSRGLELAEKVESGHIHAALRDSMGYSYSMAKQYYQAEPMLKQAMEFFTAGSDLLAQVASRLRLYAFYDVIHNDEACASEAENILTAASLLPYEPLRCQIEKRFSRLDEARSVRTGRLRVFHGIVYKNGKMGGIVSKVRRIAQTSEAVLILGESGTGKELVAHAIHQESNRRNGPFIPFNCTSLSRELVESRLFGHRKGAFTDAKADQLGVIRAAENGTLFLDEIGDLDLQCQGALLRFLQSGEIQPVGASSPVKVCVRVIAATNCDLDQQVKDGRFRGDLYFRLNTFTLCLPPLRERPDDIAALAQYFARFFSDKFGIPLSCFSPHEKELLANYHWPGNVREMESYFKRRVLLGDKVYESLPVAKPAHGIDNNNSAGGPGAPGAKGSRRWRQLSKEAKRELLAETLTATGGNITHTAKHLGVSRRAIQKICRNLTKN